MDRLINIGKWIFVGITLLVMIPAVNALLSPPEDPTIALVWIVLAIGCLGNITQWNK